MSDNPRMLLRYTRSGEINTTTEILKPGMTELDIVHGLRNRSLKISQDEEWIVDSKGGHQVARIACKCPAGNHFSGYWLPINWPTIRYEKRCLKQIYGVDIPHSL